MEATHPPPRLVLNFGLPLKLKPLSPLTPQDFRGLALAYAFDGSVGI